MLSMIINELSPTASTLAFILKTYFMNFLSIKYLKIVDLSMHIFETTAIILISIPNIAVFSIILLDCIFWIKESEEVPKAQYFDWFYIPWNQEQHPFDLVRGETIRVSDFCTGVGLLVLLYHGLIFISCKTKNSCNLIKYFRHHKYLKTL